MFYCPNCGKKNRISYNFCFKCGIEFNSFQKENYRFKEETEKEFEINEFITLKLKKERTIIYIKGKKFTQCKYLLIEIPIGQVDLYNDINSIDEASERLDHSMENMPLEQKIPPDVEFWGHCSNLQVWAENNYDTRLLHSNLAFPLLKKLADVGDLNAMRVFKDEIAKRIDSGHDGVIKYLISENYLEYFNNDELEVIDELFRERMIKKFNSKFDHQLDHPDKEFIIDLIKFNVQFSRSLKLNEFKVFKKGQKNTQLALEIINQKIIRLNIINCDLKIIPKSIKNLTNLEELNLMWNSISVLPEEIGALTKLKLLNLRSNKFSYLPDTIENLDSLERLNLDHNLITKIPPSIKGLNSLKTLLLWNNQLETLPKEIDFLQELEILGLSNNYITRLPESINHLKKLHNLDLSNNLLTKYPEGMEHLSSLTILWINNNRLEVLPESIVNAPVLEHLYLFLNPMKTEPNSRNDLILNQLLKKGINIRIPKYTK